MAGSLILVIWMFLVPLLAGGIPAAGMKKDRTGGDWKKLIFKWISGQMLLWAVFGLLAVLPIRKGMSLDRRRFLDSGMQEEKSILPAGVWL